MRHRARDVQRRIVDDARARLASASSGVGQNLAAAAMLLRAMPETSTTEGRRIQGELNGLLEDAVVRRAESSASRRQGCPSEHRTTTSRLMREALVRTGRAQDGMPAAPGRLGNEHHRRDRRAHLDEKVHRGYHRSGPTGRKLCLPKARVPLGASHNDFPTHAGGLGPHRARAGRDACSPGSPWQRAPPPRPSSPPRREGAPRLPPQAWGTLRQLGGSEPLARTTRSASFQPGHTTGAVPDPVPSPDYRVSRENSRIS